MKALRRTLVVAVLVLLGYAAWSQSAEWFGWTMPGKCTLLEAGSPVEMSKSEAKALMAVESLPAASLNCGYWPTAERGPLVLDDNGLTAPAERMRQAVFKAFGKLPDGGFAPDGITTGHIEGSAHYEGRAVDFFFRPYKSKTQRLAGWQLAQWAVLHADELKIATIIFDDHIWTRNGSVSGWSNYVHPNGPTKDPILRHLDHVHIDVL